MSPAGTTEFFSAYEHLRKGDHSSIRATVLRNAVQRLSGADRTALSNALAATSADDSTTVDRWRAQFSPELRALEKLSAGHVDGSAQSTAEFTARCGRLTTDERAALNTALA